MCNLLTPEIPPVRPCEAQKKTLSRHAKNVCLQFYLTVASLLFICKCKVELMMTRAPPTQTSTNFWFLGRSHNTFCILTLQSKSFGFVDISYVREVSVFVNICM